MEFLLGGLAATVAGFFTNPLEVLKTRMQLQGELEAKGKHVVHYRNVAHAAYVVGKHDGILALQKGLVPALWVQLIMNGMRFGKRNSQINYNYSKIILIIKKYLTFCHLHLIHRLTSNVLYLHVCQIHWQGFMTSFKPEECCPTNQDNRLSIRSCFTVALVGF